MKRKLIATLLRASGIVGEYWSEAEICLSRKARPDAQINIKILNFTIMARNTKPDYKCIECNFNTLHKSEMEHVGP